MMTLIIAAITIICFIIAIIFIPTIKIKNKEIQTYYLVTLIGAIILIILGFVNLKDLWHSLMNKQIGPLPILILFISMTIMSIILDEVGFFKYLACKTVNVSPTNTKILFILLYVIISILTIFTSNDIIILTFTPFICYFCKHTKINPLPFLIMEFVAANTWSMLLIIGNPTNIYLATTFDINFFAYLKQMFIPTLFASIISLLIMLLIFKKDLKVPLTKTLETTTIKNKFILITAITTLSICILVLVCSSYIDIPMWIISFVFMVLDIIIISIYYLIKKESPLILKNSMKRIPYPIIPFLLSMFIIIFALKTNGVITQFATYLSSCNMIIYGIIAYISCNLINNIPTAVLFTNLLSDSTYTIKYVYAVIASTNIGAYLTPIGALAGIMWMNILKKQELKFNFIQFIKYGILISLPTIIVTLIFIEIL